MRKVSVIIVALLTVLGLATGCERQQKQAAGPAPISKEVEELTKAIDRMREDTSRQAAYMAEELTRTRQYLGDLNERADFIIGLTADPVKTAKLWSIALHDLQPREGASLVDFVTMSVGKLFPVRGYEPDYGKYLKGWSENPQLLGSLYAIVKPHIGDSMKRHARQFAGVMPVLTKGYDADIGKLAVTDGHDCRFEMRRDRSDGMSDECANFLKKFGAHYGIEKPTADQVWVVGFLHRRHLQGGQEAYGAWSAMMLDVFKLAGIEKPASN